MSSRFVSIALGGLLVLTGCTDLRTGEDPWYGAYNLSDSMPTPADLPEGMVLADHALLRVEGAPVDHPGAAVERLSEEWGWGIFPRVAARPHVGQISSRDDRDFPIPRLVAYVYLRRPGGTWGPLEQAVWNRHADARRFHVLGGEAVTVAVVQDGPEDPIGDSACDRRVGWFRHRVHGRDY